VNVHKYHEYSYKVMVGEDPVECRVIKHAYVSFKDDHAANPAFKKLLSNSMGMVTAICDSCPLQLLCAGSDTIPRYAVRTHTGKVVGRGGGAKRA
jgi:hypothetical protein